MEKNHSKHQSLFVNRIGVHAPICISSLIFVFLFKDIVCMFVYLKQWIDYKINFLIKVKCQTKMLA